MMVKIKYTAIDPYYSDTTQTFIGETNESIDNQIYEFEDWLGKEHPSGISCIYKSEIIEKKRVL